MNENGTKRDRRNAHDLVFQKKIIMVTELYTGSIPSTQKAEGSMQNLLNHVGIHLAIVQAQNLGLNLQ